MNKEELLKEYPQITLLDKNESEIVESYLRKRGLLNANERVTKAETAGEGNMNCTLRISTDHRSIILKQSRPWVEKYPSIDAPWDRVIREARFYELIKEHPGVKERMPDFYDLDPLSRIIAIEDLGESRDYTDIYLGSQLLPEEIDALAEWLSKLHKLPFDEADRGSLTNRDMRELNHEHIFHFPLLQNNGMDLDAITSGLQQAADKLINNAIFVEAVSKLGRLYLEDGPTLLHGDYFPGSWLRTENGLKIIDPEFSFFGIPEFEIGVTLAHFTLAEINNDLILRFLKAYRSTSEFSYELALQFSGVEIMRRLIGVAQLPLRCDMEKKTALLQDSHLFVLNPKDTEIYKSL